METALQTNEKAWADINKNLVNIKASALPRPCLHLKLLPIIESLGIIWDGRKEETEQTVLESSKKLGFASGAFTPAMDLLAAPAPALSAEIYRTGPLSFIYDLLVPPSNDVQENCHDLLRITAGE